MAKDSWGSRVGLILAMAGNAVGFGNFLRFPVKALQNGGGAFIIPYLTCFILLGIPLLFVEWGLGRYGGRYGNHSTPFIFDSVSKKAVWKYVGVFGLFCNISIASYYCYMESWTITYVFNSITGTFNGQSADQVATFFGDYVSLKNPVVPITSWLICLTLNTYILSKGLSGGVEKVAKVGMPLLIIFGILLAIQGITLQAGTKGAINDGTVGLNFLWTPDYSTIWSPKVWLAAAGQIFFTLSVGMGSIQCYASYVRSKDDIALNALSAGWMNEFVEVLLGASIIIPISVGYLGIDRVVELVQSGGLGLGFKTLPFLFTKWGVVLGAIAGVMWFGLLFFAGITSSLAMGTPCVSFLEDEFNFSKKKAAIGFGLIIFILGLPTILFFNHGVFDEYDYWAGDVSLFVFALLETILFVWVFGINNAWKEINIGADIKIPIVFKYIMLFVTPVLLILIFASNIPEMYNKIVFSDIKEQLSVATDASLISELKSQMMYMTGSRILLISLFLGISYLVYKASKKRNNLKSQII